jgi:hypothetical protein
MRLIEREMYFAARHRLDQQIPMFYSALFSGLLFVILILSAFSSDNVFLNLFFAILFSAILFSALFGMIYGLRKLSNRHADAKVSDLSIRGKMLNVIFKGEYGILDINNETIVFHSLARFSQNKQFEVTVDEDLFIAVGDIKSKPWDKYKYKGIKRCHLSVHKMPHGPHYQFIFYDIDGALDKAQKMVEEVSKFNYEKYQK